MALPDDVTAFLTRRVASVNELEVVMLLHAEPDLAWTPADAAKRLYRPELWVGGQLEAFTQTGLLQRIDGHPPTYRWAPKDERLTATVARVADALRLRPTRVIDAIYSSRAASARRFADAFRLRDDDPPREG